MREEIENWWKQAKCDLSAAKNSVKSKDYEWACFQSHQSVEKGLKALILLKKRKLIHTHELLKLGKELGINEELYLSLRELNTEYVTSRYPNAANGIPHEIYYKEKAENRIKHAEKVIEWIEKHLEK